MYEAPYWKRT
jgi:hypothetical protein